MKTSSIFLAISASAVLTATAAAATGYGSVNNDTLSGTATHCERHVNDTVTSTPTVAANRLAGGTRVAEEPDSLSDIYGDLGELVVTAKKEVVKSDGSKLTYDMEQDDSSKGQTLLEALRKVPLVTVDGQDAVYIKGSSDFRVYVNGKEDPMLTANYKTVFKSMPAESVSRIEVITEPGAKYDAEGTGGILNLVTERKQTKEGYTGTASISANNAQFVGSLYGRMRYDKVTADAFVNYANNKLQKQESIQNIETINKDSEEIYRQLSQITQKFGFDYIGSGLNLSWEPTENDLVTMGADLTWVNADLSGMSTVNSMFTKAGALQWRTRQNLDGIMLRLGTSGNISYRRLLGRQGHSLTGAYRFNFGQSNMDLYSHNGVEEGETYVNPYESNLNHDLQREHTVTIDYENALAEGKHVIEAGTKGIFRRNGSLTSQQAGASDSETTPLSDSSIRQLQDVYALYATYKGTFGNVVGSAGLRYEHTYMGLDFLQNQMPNFRRHLNDLVPNAAVTYMFGPAANLRAAYQMRIRRPSVDQMNPAKFQITQTWAQMGNPDLESEKYNSVSLTFSKFGTRLGGNVSLSYSQSDNTIEEYNYFIDDVGIRTYGNYGKNKTTSLSGFLNWSISNKMTLMLNGQVSYTDIKAVKENLHNSGWGGDYGINWSYTGPWNVKYGVYGGQTIHQINLQGYFSGWYYYGLSLKKSFLKDDAFSVILTAGNFLTKYTHFKMVTETPTHLQTLRVQNRSWNAGVTLSWNFGRLQDQVKKTSANLENDDRKQSDKSTGGGISL